MQTTQPAYIVGQLVTAASQQAVQDAARNLVGSAIAAIVGINSANASDVPFTVTAAGGMSIAAGGSGGQKVLLNSASGQRLIDAIPSQTFTVPTANGSNPRNDILYGTYNQAQVLASSSGQVATESGSTITVSSQNIYNANEAITYTYVTGTPAATPTDPAGPANSVALARIVVPAAATSIVSGNITVLLISAQAQILSGVAGFVNLTTNQSIAGNKTFTGVTTVGGIQFAATNAAFSSVAGVRVNTAGSIIASPTAPGHGIYLGYDDAGLLNIYFGPSNLWGNVSSAGMSNPTGFIVSNGGSATTAALQFGNATAGGATTTIGASGGSLNGIAPDILNIANGSTQLVTLDRNGNLGLAGGIAAELNISWGGGALFADGHAVFGGAITSLGVQLPTTFGSTDASVNISTSVGTLNVTLPSGVITSYSSTSGTVLYSQAARALSVDVARGLVLRAQQRITASGSITLTLPSLPGLSGRTWLVYAAGTADLGSGSVTLSGTGASWEVGQTINDDGVSGAQTIELIGSATPGQTPSATYNLPNLGGGGGGIFYITATLQ